MIQKTLSPVCFVRMTAICLVALLMACPALLLADEQSGTTPKQPEVSIQEAIDKIKALAGPDSFTTDRIVTAGVEAILDPGADCLNYCITDVCVRLIINIYPPSVKIILTPKIAHYTPDFVVSSYNENGLEPWEEWRRTFAKAESEIQIAIMDLILPYSFGRGGPSNEKEAKTGDVSNVRFKESDINGNPLVLLINMLAGQSDPMANIRNMIAMDDLCSGSFGSSEFGSICVGTDYGSDSSLVGDVCAKNPEASVCKKPETGNGFWDEIGLWPGGGGENGDDSEKDPLFDEALGALDKFGSFKMVGKIFMSKELTESMEIMEMVGDIKSAYQTLSQVQSFMSDIQNMFAGAGFGVEFAIDRYFCPTEVIPILPYYLSQIDTPWWRDFLDYKALIAWQPFMADMIHWDRILRCNIIADLDGIARKAFDLDEIRGGCVVGANELSMWGTIYPRTGTVIHNNDRKAASVMAERAMDILLDQGEALRLRMPVTPRDGRTGIWQPIFPEVGTCSASYRAKLSGYSSMFTDPAVSISTITRAVEDFAKGNTQPAQTMVQDKDPTLDSRTGNAWNYWRPYSCCMSTRGSHIATTNIPDICL